MLRRAAPHLIGSAATRIPGLRRLPVFKLIAVAEVALLARTHIGKLQPAERRRLLELVRIGRGRMRNLSDDERAELAGLVATLEPRLFAGLVADKFSPVPLPHRFVRGARRRRS